MNYSENHDSYNSSDGAKAKSTQPRKMEYGNNSRQNCSKGPKHMNSNQQFYQPQNNDFQNCLNYYPVPFVANQQQYQPMGNDNKNLHLDTSDMNNMNNINSMNRMNSNDQEPNFYSNNNIGYDAYGNNIAQNQCIYNPLEILPLIYSFPNTMANNYWPVYANSNCYGVPNHSLSTGIDPRRISEASENSLNMDQVKTAINQQNNQFQTKNTLDKQFHMHHTNHQQHQPQATMDGQHMGSNPIANHNSNWSTLQNQMYQHQNAYYQHPQHIPDCNYHHIPKNPSSATQLVDDLNSLARKFSANVTLSNHNDYSNSSVTNCTNTNTMVRNSSINSRSLNNSINTNFINANYSMVNPLPGFTSNTVNLNKKRYAEILASVSDAQIKQNLAQTLTNINPSTFQLTTAQLSPENTRFFVIKSYSEDDIHRAIKYLVWCSTISGNRTLKEAYETTVMKRNGRIFLFYSVNGSGLFQGIAEMCSTLDPKETCPFWSQSKWTGKFDIKWHYVKDVRNTNLRHIRNKANQNKPVTNSRDAVEIEPFQSGMDFLKVFHNVQHETSIFDDYEHYELREAESNTDNHNTSAS